MRELRYNESYYLKGGWTNSKICSLSELIDKIDNSDKINEGLVEVIPPGAIVKPYFDFDAYDRDDNSFLSECKDQVDKWIDSLFYEGKARYPVFQHWGTKSGMLEDGRFKNSFRCFITGMQTTPSILKEHCKKYIPNADTAVYSSGRAMKCLNKFKNSTDTRRLKLLDDSSTTLDTIIQYVEDSWNEIPPIQSSSPVKNNTQQSFISVSSEGSVEQEFISKLIDLFNYDRADERQSWIKGLVSILRAGGDDSLCHKFSSISSKYDYEDTQAMIDDIQSRNYLQGGIAVLRKWAKEDNLNKYMELSPKNSSEYSFMDDDNEEEEIEITHEYVALKLKELYPEDFMWDLDAKSQWCFNGKFWENNDTIMFERITKIRKHIQRLIVDNDKYETKEKAKLIKSTELLSNEKFKKSVIYSTRPYFKQEIKFDQNPNLFGFKDCVYDIEKDEYRDYRRDDFISINCGYDYIPASDEDISIFNEKYLNKVFPLALPNREEQVRLFLDVLSTCIVGKNPQKLACFTGNGRNGKGEIKKLMSLMLGNYFCEIPAYVVLGKEKSGANTELAQCSYKRAVFIEEPDSSAKLNTELIKDLTGGETIKARHLYSNNSTGVNHMTLIINCNDKPDFNDGATGNAMSNRVLVTDFPSTFTSDEYLLDDSKFIFKADPDLDKYKEEFKRALWSLCIRQLKTKECPTQIRLSKQAEFEKDKWLNNSDIFYSWFTSNLDPSPGAAAIEFKTLFLNFTGDCIHQLKTARAKKKYSQTHCKNLLMKHFIDDWFPAEKIKGIDYNNRIKNWVFN